MGCRKWGCKKWGLKGCLPSLPGNRPKSAFFRPFSAFFALFRRPRTTPGKSGKRRKKAFFLRNLQISLNPHFLNPHLRHSKLQKMFNITFERFGRIASNLRFAIKFLVPRNATRRKGVRSGNPETIRATRATHVNLRIDSRESGNLSFETMLAQLRQDDSLTQSCAHSRRHHRRSRPSAAADRQAHGPARAQAYCLRGPAATLFTSHYTCSDCITKLLGSCFSGGIVQLSRDMLQMGNRIDVPVCEAKC